MAERVAVIEIGSRAVRLLVADASRDGLSVADKAVEPHLLSAIGGRDKIPYQAAMRKIAAAIADYRERGIRDGASVVLVFGTQIVRSMPEEHRRSVEALAGGPIVVLGGEDEGRASLVAGIIGLEREFPSPTGEYSVIDQGGGSLEVAWGTRADGDIELGGSVGFKFGANELRESVRAQGAGATLRIVRTAIEASAVPVRSDVPTLVLGSAITTVAWADVRPDVNSRYSPDEVHGLTVTLSRLAALMKMAATDRAAFRMHIDPRNPAGGEPEVVEAGIIGLAPIIKHLGVKSVIVSGWGTRYGVAWLLARGFTFTSSQPGSVQRARASLS